MTRSFKGLSLLISSMRTVHLLMYLFTNSNAMKIGPKEFTALFYSLQNWRSLFERSDKDRSGRIDINELRDALLSLGFSVSPVILDLLVSKFDKSGGKNTAIEYDNFIECCLTVKNAVLELARVLKATEQVVSGKLYRLTLEVIEAGEKKIYEAKVWMKPWMNFKQLHEFKNVIPSFTTSDLGLKSDGNGFEWRLVSTNDPEVQETAKHAMKSIQQRSNTLFPYKLIDIILARAKVVEDRVKFRTAFEAREGQQTREVHG